MQVSSGVLCSALTFSVALSRPQRRAWTENSGLCAPDCLPRDMSHLLCPWTQLRTRGHHFVLESSATQVKSDCHTGHQGAMSPTRQARPTPLLSARSGDSFVSPERCAWGSRPAAASSWGPVSWLLASGVCLEAASSDRVLRGRHPPACAGSPELAELGGLGTLLTCSPPGRGNPAFAAEHPRPRGWLWIVASHQFLKGSVQATPFLFHTAGHLRRLCLPTPGHSSQQKSVSICHPPQGITQPWECYPTFQARFLGRTEVRKKQKITSQSPRICIF